MSQQDSFLPSSPDIYLVLKLFEMLGKAIGLEVKNCFVTIAADTAIILGKML